jgi:leader peptidase (prepilin peptidase)/N-methyltransferase
MPLSADTFTVNLYMALASPLIGSGIAAGAARFANGAAWDFTPSTCPLCGRRLGLLELVPLVSWVAQRGKCRGCSAPISPAYPLIELAAIGVAIWAWLAVPAAVFAVTCVMGWLLLALSAIDIRTRRLPDVLNLLLAVSGIAVTAMIDTSLVVAHLAAAAVGYGALVAVELAYRHLRGRDGLGRGDSKLLGAIGAWVGPQGLAACLFVAAASAIVFILVASRVRGTEIRGDMAIAFGPFLALGGWIVWMYAPVLF